MKDAEAGELVARVRAALRLSQREFASRGGVERAALGRLELGRDAKVSFLRRLLAAFGGGLELAARFERPLDALGDEFERERAERRVERNWRRRMSRQAIK